MSECKGPSSEEILDGIISKYRDVNPIETWGEISVFYNPQGALPRGVYFATVKSKDGENDRASKLDRKGVFRLNIGTPKEVFTPKFGPLPKRPPKGGVVRGPWDFQTLNSLTPHPVYGWMSWVSILNPSAEHLEQLSPMIDAAYAKATKSFEKRMLRLKD